MNKTLLFGTIIAFVFTTGAATLAQAELDGAALLEQRCSVCHPSARPKAAKKSPEQWASTVTRMQGKGAKISEEERKVLLDHLSKTYKP